MKRGGGGGVLMVILTGKWVSPHRWELRYREMRPAKAWQAGRSCEGTSAPTHQLAQQKASLVLNAEATVSPEE